MKLLSFSDTTMKTLLSGYKTWLNNLPELDSKRLQKLEHTQNIVINCINSFWAKKYTFSIVGAIEG